MFMFLKLQAFFWYIICPYLFNIPKMYVMLPSASLFLHFSQFSPFWYPDGALILRAVSLKKTKMIPFFYLIYWINKLSYGMSHVHIESLCQKRVVMLVTYNILDKVAILIRGQLLYPVTPFLSHHIILLFDMRGLFSLSHFNRFTRVFW